MFENVKDLLRQRLDIYRYNKELLEYVSQLLNILSANGTEKDFKKAIEVFTSKEYEEFVKICWYSRETISTVSSLIVELILDLNLVDTQYLKNALKAISIYCVKNL
ncbi:MAG: hypothetical protein QXP34_01375 [Candidatus Aenigmatarchaeota archaeon]